MSSRWLTARKRKRVRAVDPYLGFYPQSDPPSESGQEHQPGMAPTQPVLDTIQAQDSISGAAEDASSSIMVSAERVRRVSCSPKQPRPPKHTYAARKRRRVDSDEEFAPSDAGETEEVSYWSSDEVPSGRPRAAAQSTKPTDRTKVNTQGKLYKSKAVRGPFATRLIEQSLATGTRLPDDLQALNDTTVPRLKLVEKQRVRATQPFAASPVSRRTYRADIPTYSFPPRRVSLSVEDEPGGIAKNRDGDKRRPSRALRLSQLRQPATEAKRKATPKELVFKPLTFQTVSSRNRTQPTKPTRREHVAPAAAPTAQAVLRFKTVQSARRTVAKPVLATTHASTSSRSRHGLPVANAPARYASSQPVDRALEDTGGDDCGFASLSPSDIVMQPPRPAGSSRISQARQPARTHKRISAESISSYSARTASKANTQPTASLVQDSPIALHSQPMSLSTHILVPGTPVRGLAGGSTTSSSSLYAAEYSSCFVPPSMSLLSSSPAASMSPGPEQDAFQILVIDSSQVLTPDTQLSPRSSPNQSQDDAPPVTPQTAQIFVQNSTQVIVPETSPPSSSQRLHGTRYQMAERDGSAVTKRTKFFKSVADLSDSVLDMIQNNAFAARPFTPTT